ncbi:MAG: histidine kinase dimerization/phospho-acceptor domain-containing protein [Opitutales bacterium]
MATADDAANAPGARAESVALAAAGEHPHAGGRSPRLLLVAPDGAQRDRLLQELREAFPHGSWAVLSSLPADSALASLFASAELVLLHEALLPSGERARAACFPPESAPVVVLLEDPAVERAVSLFAAGAQEVVNLQAPGEVDWSRVWGFATARHERLQAVAARAPREAGESTWPMFPRFPGLLFVVEADDTHHRLDDGNLLPSDDPDAIALGCQAARWVRAHRGAADPCTTETHDPPLFYVGEGRERRTFLLHACEQDEPDPARWLVVLTEITALDRLLTAREGAIEELVHDLKSPLAAIAMGLHLGQEAGSPDERKEMLEVAEESAQSMRHLIEERLGRGRQLRPS